MPRIRPKNLRILLLAAVFAMVAGSGLAKQNAAEPQIHAASIGHGITLHYLDEGAGVPVVFVHGSLSNGGYWADQIGPFSKHYRAIAYSRRYNHPNTNPARPGYSAVVDSDDLAAFIHTLRYSATHGQANAPGLSEGRPRRGDPDLHGLRFQRSSRLG